MSTFRQRNSSSGEESAGAESDGEENLTDRILKNRPKAVAKRRIPATIKNDELKTEQINDGNDEEMDKKEAAPSAGKLWAETAVMQTLEEGIGSTSSTAKLDRGVESYLTKTTKFDLANRKRHRPDDISDSIWDNDQQMVEEEKGKPSPPDANEPSKEEKSATIEELIKEEVNVKMDPVVDLWDGVDTGAVELPIEREQQQRNNNKQWRGRGRGGWNGGNQFKRFKQDQADFGGGGGWRGGRGGGKWQWQRGGGQGGGNAGQQKKMLPPEKFVPRRLIAADYDQQKLFNTVLDPETLTDGELVKTLVEALGEKEPAIIEKAVEFTGKQLAVEIFKECQEVEKSGGMLTKKGDRRKAPGGVFLELFNKREEITEEQKKAMYQLGSELMRKSGCHPKWWDKREKKKEAKTAMELDTAEAAKADEALPPDLDNEDLPASSELIKPNIVEEVADEIVTEESSKNIENGSTK